MKMQAKNSGWLIIVGGMVGTLLWTGQIRAQPFPGGLPVCEDSLTQTRGQLSTCTSNLSTCTTSLGTCQTDLGLCQDALAQCQVFPGDGVDGPALSYPDNNDGTFTDNNTLFMWEKKGTSGGIHDVNNRYTWSDAFAVF